MNNNNPADMSNEDLEKAMQNNTDSNTSGNQENVSKSTAAEGTLKDPADDPSSAIARGTTYNADKEQDLDDLIHRKDEEKHNVNMPDPEEISSWEDKEIDDDKFSG